MAHTKTETGLAIRRCLAKDSGFYREDAGFYVGEGISDNFIGDAPEAAIYETIKAAEEEIADLDLREDVLDIIPITRTVTATTIGEPIQRVK